MIRRICVLLAFLTLVSISGVNMLNASWVYPNESIPIEIDTTMGVGLTEFFYKPEEVLPDDDGDEAGENHLMLIYNITDHITYGLNSTSKPIVGDLLKEEKGIVYSPQKVSGGNLKHMLIDSHEVEALEFAVEYKTDTLYCAYTFQSDYMDYDYLNDEIEVYKTDMVYEDGEWKAVLSYKGVAKVVNIVKSKNEDFLSIDVPSWRRT